MWIEKLKSGKYRAAERYTDPLTGKQKRVSVTIEKNTAATRKAAEAALNEKISSMYRRFDYESITLSELVDLYRKYQKLTVKKSTYKRNYHATNTLISILGANTLVSSLSAGYVNECMMATGKAPGTVNEHITRLKALLRWGYKSDYVEDVSWLSKLEPLPNKEKKAKLAEKFLEADELNQLLNNLKVDRWRLLTKFLALSGLRVGEAFALEIGDIDLKARQIHVTKTYDANNNVVTTAKTTSSEREVFIQDELLPLCKSLKSEAAAKKLLGGNGRIFFKNRYDYCAYEKYFRENTMEVLGRRLTAHALRHTHVALLAEHGVPLEIISRRLGHKNSKVTRDVYYHVTKKLKEKDDQALQNIHVL